MLLFDNLANCLPHRSLRPTETKHSIRNPFGECFLLVSANGIIPIAVMFYNLNLCSRVTLYQTTLTAISATFGSYTGIEIVKLLSKPYNRTGRIILSDSDWPAATGRSAPEGICGRKYHIKYPKKSRPEKIFLIGAALCDVLIIGVIASCLARRFPNWRPSRYRSRPNSGPESLGQSMFSENTIGWMRKAVHVSAVLILTWCTMMEYFFFYQMLVPQYDRIVNVKDWGFGQIVGITVWAVVIIDFIRHEISWLYRWYIKRP